MGGKKTVEKSREWEKERRDKLNVGFNDLYKLLPDHDPSISLSKMDILRKAAEYIRLLQNQNDEIIKSGDSEVLKNEAERLKKRVAYLLLKTKDLVAALREAGVSIPTNKKKKKSKAKKVTNGKDQNRIPLLSGTKVLQQVPCAVVVGNGGKSTASVLPGTPLPGKKVKCGCEKAAKKNPLSELNCTIAPATSSHPGQCQVNAAPEITQPSQMILSNPLQANIQTLAPTLGPRTLIFRDGRVVTVPPAAPIIPQILVKPQPTFIVMQRAPVVPAKRDKMPLIAPKRRDITQTTFANKAPIPAIKTFRLESLPRLHKPKGKKKKEERTDSTPLTNKSASPATSKNDDALSSGTDSNNDTLKSPNAKKLKRKAEAVNRKTKVAKSSDGLIVAPKSGSEVPEENGNMINEQIAPDGTSHTVDKESDVSMPVTGTVNIGVEPVQSGNLLAGPNIASCAAEKTPLTDAAPVLELPQKLFTTKDHSPNSNSIVKSFPSSVEHQSTGIEPFVHHNGSLDDPSTNNRASEIQSIEWNQDIGKVSGSCTKDTDIVCPNSAQEPNITPSHGILDGPTTNQGDSNNFQLMPHNKSVNCEPNDSAKTVGLCGAPSAVDHSRTMVQELSLQKTSIIESIPSDKLRPLEKTNAPSGLSEDLQLSEIVEHGNISVKERHMDQPFNVPTENNSTTTADSSFQTNAMVSSSSCCPSSITETLASSTAKPLDSSQTSTSLSQVVPKGAAPVPSSPLLNHSHGPAGTTSSYPLTPTVSEPSNTTKTSSLPSSSNISVSSAIGNLVCLPSSLPSSHFSSYTATPTSSLPSNTTTHTHTPSSGVNYAASRNYPPPLGGSQCNYQHVIQSSRNDYIVGGTSKTWSSFVDSHVTSNATDEHGGSKSSKDITQSNSQKDSEVCPSANVSKHSVNYQSAPFGISNPSKPLSNAQYSKSSTNLENEPRVHSLGTSQNQCYSENGRVGSSTQLTVHDSRSIQPNVTSARSNAALSSSSQVYSFGLPVVPPETSRTESFFNYDNPIAAVPADPFFGNFKPVDLPVCCPANTGFGYSTFTTQAPPVRSVARQLFPADPLCSISNGYSLDSNLPPLNSSTFQFTSYSNANSFREPLLFPNDFLPTPSKNTAAMENLQNEKQSSTNNTHNIPDLVHTCNDSLANVSSGFSSGQVPSSTFIPPDFRPGLDQSNRKQFQDGNQPTYGNKGVTKSGRDGNFSMNAITSEVKHQDAGNVFITDQYKTQHFNLPYLNTSQGHNLETSNFNTRDRVPSQTTHTRNVMVPNVSNLTDQSIANKNAQKTPNQGSHPQTSAQPKEFSSSSSSGTRSHCEVRSNAPVFHSDGSIYQGSSASTQCTNNFRVFNSSNSHSSNQGVQTNHSYLCNPKPQQLPAKLPTSTNQVPSCSSQANQVYSSAYGKNYSKNGQGTLYTVSENHMKITECHQGNETAGCSMIDKNPGAITSMHSSAKSVPSAESMFSHSNTLQSSMSASFSRPSTSTALQAIYTHPTTASNNQTYMRDASMLTNQSSFGLRNASLRSQTNQPCYQPVQGASASMIFQTGDNVTHQSTDTLQRKVRNASGHSHSDQSDVNMFGSMGPSHSQSSRTSTHLDVTPTFSVSSITGYPSQSSRRNDSDSMPNRNLNHSYSQPTNTKQSSNITKGSTQQYPPSSSHNPVPTAKQCDYPFSSILTGLNDPVLSSSLSTNESRQSSNAPANPASSKKSLCIDKPLDKQYSTNTEGSSFKTSENSYNADYLTGKETERNFMPIIEDVRLTSEFSNDLFSSLQVPTGGAHADSISPTAAFLLAFPLVSTSKNAENPHDSDPQDNNTATPTTILQIGNIEPSNAEMFHPLEFGKDMEGHDYLGDLSDKCKRKENIFEKQKKPSNPFNSYSYPSMSGDYSIHYDQSWSDPKAKTGEGRKKNDKPKFCGNGSNYELCKDKKKKNKISVNWMAAPDVETFQKDQEASSFQANSFPMDIDPLPDLCSSKKANAYTWSPSKSLLPLDSALVIPSTLPTLVGDLALGTPTPVDSYKRCDVGKKQDKSSEKQNSQKAQSNFLSVSQLVDPKSKKKLSDKCKKADKKKAGPFPKRKDSSSGGSNEPCMYPDGFLPPLGWDKYRYRNNYSAEALIAMQDPNPNETVNFTYQQNSNYYVPSDVNQEHLQQSQQYQNSFNFSQNPSFSVDEYQNTSFSMNTGGSSASKRGGSDKRCREDASRFSARAPYQGHPPNQPVPSAPPSSHSSNFTSNTTTSVTNFNLSTIFPEINERTGSQSQTGPSQQHQQQHGPQSHPHNISSFQNPNGSTKYPTQHL